MNIGSLIEAINLHNYDNDQFLISNTKEILIHPKDVEPLMIFYHFIFFHFKFINGHFLQFFFNLMSFKAIFFFCKSFVLLLLHVCV